MASATAFVRRNLLSENGGAISIIVNRVKYIYIPALSNRLCETEGEHCNENNKNDFKSIKEQFLLDVKTAVEMEDIPFWISV